MKITLTTRCEVQIAEEEYQVLKLVVQTSWSNISAHLNYADESNKLYHSPAINFHFENTDLEGKKMQENDVIALIFVGIFSAGLILILIIKIWPRRTQI